MKTQLLLLALFISPVLHAQWERLPMPQGGNCQSLGTAHNRVWTQWSNQNFYSDDEGQSWTPWSLQDTLTAENLWISDTVLMVIGRRKSQFPSSNFEETIFKSVDNGNIWQPVFYDTLHQFDIHNVFSAGNYLFLVDDWQYGNRLLFRSGDQGATWQNLSVDGNGTNERKLDYVKKGQEALVASLYIDDGIGEPSYYWARSIDFGQTWQKIQTYGFDENYDAHILGKCWIFDAYNTAAPIYVSYDDGATFGQIPDDPCNRWYYFAAPNTLYAFDNDCFSQFNPGNNLWESIPLTPDFFSYLVQTESGSLLAGGGNQGKIWRKTTAEPWVNASAGLISSGVSNFFSVNDAFFLFNEAGISRSDDQVQTWMDKPEPTGLLTLKHWPTWDNRLVAYSHSSLFISANGGETWNWLWPQNGSADPNFRGLSIYKNSLFLQFQSNFRAGILYSPFRGLVWDTILPPASFPLAGLGKVLVGNDGVWMTMFDQNSWYLSSDLGLTWSESGLSEYYGTFFNQDKNLFFVGNQSFYSPDGGTNWLPALGIPAGNRLVTISSGENGRWYGVVSGGSIFVSADFGANWSFWENPGYPEVAILYPFGEYLYADRYPTGLWRRSISTSTHNPVPSDAPMLLISPNPAQNEVEIRWAATTPSNTPIYVFDLFGKLMFEGKTGQSETLNIKIGHWLSGSYFVKIGDAVSVLVKK